MQTCPSVFGTLSTLLTSYFVLNGQSKYYLVDAKVEGLKFNAWMLYFLGRVLSSYVFPILRVFHSNCLGN